jgi:hypothetical protein
MSVVLGSITEEGVEVAAKDRILGVGQREGGQYGV